MTTFQLTHTLPATADQSHPITHHSLTNLLLSRLRGLFLVVLMPLVLSFMLVLGCAPTATTSASPPDELQQVANLIMSGNTGLTATPDRAAATPTLRITGLVNDASMALTQTLSIPQDPGVLTTVPDSIEVTALREISPEELPDKFLMVTFGTAEAVRYTLNIYISGAPIADWFTGPDIAGGGKDVSRYITASFSGQAGTVTLDATTKILSVTGFTNVENGTAGSITTTSAFPMGFSATPITLLDPDGIATGLTTITPSRATLAITETGATSNSVPYTLATIPLAKLSKFTPGGTHITVKDNALPEDSADITTDLDFSVTPAESPGANPKITITGLTNARSMEKTYTLTVAPVADIFATPGGTDIIITIAEPADFWPGLGTLSVATITVTNQGDSEATIYNLEVRFSGALITEWFKTATIGNYFSGATFAGQSATLTLGADNVITIVASSGMLTNVPDGLLVPAPNLPNGFELINNFTDPDGPGLGEVTDGMAGTLTITEMDADIIIQSQDYPVQISLVAYTSPVAAADVTAMFAGTTTSPDDIRIVGNVITILASAGFSNDNTSVPGSVTITSSAAYTLTPDPTILSIPNPDGITATNTEITTTDNALTVTTTSSGAMASHTVVVEFRFYISSLVLSVTGMTPVSSGGAVTLADTMKCQVLTASDIAIIINGEPNTDYSVANPPSYYDRSLLWSSLTSATKDTDPISVTADLDIIDKSSKEIAADPFPLTVSFPQCQVADLPGSGTEALPYQISKAEHLELFAHLVNNSNATYGASHYDLTADIDLEVANAPWTKSANGMGFTPIGSTLSATGTDIANYTTHFTGMFDCDDPNNANTNVVYAISNLYINNTRPNDQMTNGRYKGLFGMSSGTIQNCRLASANVSGNRNIGGLVGFNFASAFVINSYVVGGAVSGTTNVGGLVGHMDGTISASYATGSVTGTNDVGGLVGYMGGKISASYATGSVTGTTNVGGLVGYIDDKISASYATGAVSGTTNVGGLAGRATSISTISASYATGAVSGTSGTKENIGGLVGNMSGTINNSYATGAVSGIANVGGLVGVAVSVSITSTYATGNVSGTSDVGNLIGNNGGYVITSTGASFTTVGTGVTNSYYNNGATRTVNGNIISGGKGVGSDSATVTTANLFPRTTTQMQVGAPVTTGDTVYVGWNTTIWNFTAGKYPRLIGVVCASRQYNPTATDCTSTLAP